MQTAIIIDRNGYRDGTAPILRSASGGVLINGDLYHISPTDERTQPEGYVICNVDEALWQIAVSEQALSRLTGVGA